MMKDTAIAVLKAGGNVRTKAGMRDNMMEIAAVARQAGRHVTFVGTRCVTQ
jgi:hypothetical protein